MGYTNYEKNLSKVMESSYSHMPCTPIFMQTMKEYQSFLVAYTENNINFEWFLNFGLFLARLNLSQKKQYIFPIVSNQLAYYLFTLDKSLLVESKKKDKISFLDPEKKSKSNKKLVENESLSRSLIKLNKNLTQSESAIKFVKDDEDINKSPKLKLNNMKKKLDPLIENTGKFKTFRESTKLFRFNKDEKRLEVSKPPKRPSTLVVINHPVILNENNNGLNAAFLTWKKICEKNTLNPLEELWWIPSPMPLSEEIANNMEKKNEKKIEIISTFKKTMSSWKLGTKTSLRLLRAHCFYLSNATFKGKKIFFFFTFFFFLLKLTFFFV